MGRASEHGSSHYGEQIAPYGEQQSPDGGIDNPFRAVGLVHLVSSLAVEAYSFALYVGHLTMLHVDVAVSAQHNVLALNLHYAVQHEVLLVHFRQSGHAYCRLLGLYQQLL